MTIDGGIDVLAPITTPKRCLRRSSSQDIYTPTRRKRKASDIGSLSSCPTTPCVPTNERRRRLTSRGSFPSSSRSFRFEKNDYIFDCETELLKVLYSPVDLDESLLSLLYRGATNKISTSTTGMYGEIRPTSLINICEEFIKYGLDNKSVFLDLGSGRGAPNLIFANHTKLFASIGIENCPLAFMSSVHLLLQLLYRDVHSLDLCCDSFCDNLQGTETRYTTPTRVTNMQDINSATPKSQLQGAYIRTVYEGTLTNGVYNETVSSSFQDVLNKFKCQASKLGLGFINEDLTAFTNFNGVTHFYSFDAAMENVLINNMVQQFMATETAWAFASFQSDLITKFGLKNCRVVAKVPCNMYISGESRTCYIYIKDNWEVIKRLADASLPSHPFVDEININQWNEPATVMDLIKLAKMSLEHQFHWYLKKLNLASKNLVTRSNVDTVYGYNSKLRQQLVKEREAILEEMASAQDEVTAYNALGRLLDHITTNTHLSLKFP